MNTVNTPPRRSRAALAALALATLSAAGCFADDRQTASCGVVMDITGFRGYEVSKSIVDRNLPAFLDGCGWVAYAAITGNSEGSPCQEAPIPLYADTNNELTDKRVHQKLLQEAAARAERLRTCALDDARGSDVLGGLRVMADRLAAAPDSGGERRIAVFSDLMSNTGGLDLSACDVGAESARTSIVTGLKEKELIADLGGSAIDVYGFNLLSERRPECVPPLESLWKLIFATAGVGASNLTIH